MISAMELPQEPVLRALTQRYGRLVEKLGGEVGDRPLVLPTADFFPDRFTKDAKGARRLLKRMKKHAGLQDVPIKLKVVDLDVEAAANCSSGACAAPSVPGAGQEFARLDELDDGWLVRVPDVELQHPVVLTTNLARVLGHIFVLECSEDEELFRQLDVEGELAAVALGFGPLLLSGSYIYTKSCGGPNVAKVTRLGTPELAVATALFAHSAGHRLRSAGRELDATQQALLESADEWAKSNERLVKLLTDAPAQVARGEFALSEAKPWLMRVLSKKKKSEATADPANPDALLDSGASLDEIEAMMATLPASEKKAKKQDPKLDELKSLVDEAFRESRADAE